MSWYLTWQDGVAVLLALVGLLFAWWLHRKAAPPHGCGRCPMLQEGPVETGIPKKTGDARRGTEVRQPGKG